MIVANALAALGPIIRDICAISGIPGVSLGVLHKNEVVHTASFGYADVERKIPCDSDTAFVLGSLSKAITAALLASLHDDGTISSWDSPVRSWLPAFNRSDIYGETTLSDLLTHRTGLAALDSLWLASDGVPFLPRSQAVETLNGAPGVLPFRSYFLYNNLGYEVLGQVIEKVSGTTFARALRDRLFEPLGMKQTYYMGESRVNEAKAYASLANGSAVPIATPLSREDDLMGPAGGVRSSVNDLLLLYKAFLEAAENQMTNEASSKSPTQPNRPPQHVLELWKGHVPLPSSSLREHSYGFGWARAQLPGILAPGDNGPSDLNPVVGIGAPSKLAVYHGGKIPGFSTYNALFPESGSAVVVLTNSMSRNNGVRWIGELLVEALFNNSHNSRDYRAVAKQSAEVAVQQFEDIRKSLAAGRTVGDPVRSLDSYVGDYCNVMGNFLIRVRLNRTQDGLQVAFMGREADTFQLIPYRTDSFYWTLTYDQTAKLARGTGYPAEYYILKFGSQGNEGRITSLWWKHDPYIAEPGEIFKKAKGSAVGGMFGQVTGIFQRVMYRQRVGKQS